MNLMMSWKILICPSIPEIPDQLDRMLFVLCASCIEGIVVDSAVDFEGFTRAISRRRHRVFLKELPQHAIQVGINDL